MTLSPGTRLGSGPSPRPADGGGIGRVPDPEEEPAPVRREICSSLSGDRKALVLNWTSGLKK